MNIVIKKKKIKNFYIRIVQQEVRISVPKRAKQKDIDLFIEKNKSWILNKLSLSQTVINSKITDSNLKEAEVIFNEAVLKYLEIYSEEVPVKVNIKEQKTRWGSCSKSRRVINLNIALLELPQDIMEHVIAHEVAHLQYANHKKEFYEHLKLARPKYKEEIMELKKYTLTRC